jgi:hypothetical protein
MKNIFSLSFALLLSLTMGAQSINSFFNDLEDRDDIAIVSVNKEMFKMIASMDVEFKEEGLGELIKGINSLKIYIQEDKADYDLFKKVRAMAQSASMAELLSVKDGSERVYMYTDKNEGADYVKNLLLMVHDDDQNVFIRLDGKVNLKELSKLTDKMGIDGLEHLKKIEQNKKP